MDEMMISIFLGFILVGILIASPIAYHIGRRSAFRQFEIAEDESETVLDAEVIQ